jgi:hypothetical protein
VNIILASKIKRHDTHHLKNVSVRKNAGGKVKCEMVPSIKGFWSGVRRLR